jgi:RNA polymerase sigma-70 factor (ECF subfamily)
VVQETAIGTAKHLPEYRYDQKVCRFKTWLLNLASWRIKDQLKKRRKAAGFAGELPGSGRAKLADEDSSRTETVNRVPDPSSISLDALFEQEWRKNLFAAALERVKDGFSLKQFQIFDLLVIQEWPAAQVAKALGVGLANVYVCRHRISKAVKKEVLRLETQLERDRSTRMGSRALSGATVDQPQKTVQRSVSVNSDKNYNRAGSQLHVADLDALLERSKRVRAFGNKFLGAEPFEARIDDGFHHGRVIDFLALVNFAAAGHAARVIMGDVLMIRADGGDHVAFHDLHVIDVVEQLEALRADAFDQLNSPGRVVAHVIVVVMFAVEQFHANVHLVLFSDWRNALEPDSAVLQTLLVAHSLAVARKTNNVRITVVGDDGGRLFEEFHDFIVMLQSVEAFGDSPRHTADHGANQVVFLERREIIHDEQLDRLQADLFAGLTKFFQRDAAIAPFANGMIDVVLELGTDCFICCLQPAGQTGGGCNGNRAAGDFAKSRTTGHGVFHET